MYKNPRLKHVKKIRELCREIEGIGGVYWSEQILNQCNLLLETKKRKKPSFDTWKALEDYLFKDCEPSPQPQMKEIELVTATWECGTIAGDESLQEIKDELNELIDHLNIINKKIR